MYNRQNSILKYIGHNRQSGTALFLVVAGTTKRTVALKFDASIIEHFRVSTCYSVWSDKRICEPKANVISLIEV